MKFKTFTEYKKSAASRTKTHCLELDSLEQFVDFDTVNFVSFCGRPSSGKSTVLIDTLLSRNLTKNERSLFIYSDQKSVDKLLIKHNKFHKTNNILIPSRGFGMTDDLVPILEMAFVEFYGEKIDSVYIDDFDKFHYDYRDEYIELEEETTESNYSFNKTKIVIDYLSMVNQKNKINIFLTGHVNRKPDIRGGDHKPRLSDIENPLLEKVSSKLVLI